MSSLARSLACRRIAGPGITSPLLSFHSIVPQGLQQQRRTVTNATKPDYTENLHTVPRVDAKPGGWHPTLVHSSGEVKFTVIRLQPDGGEVPIHYHNKVWDYFMPLEGEAVIETETKDGVKKDFEMKPGSFLAVGPEDAHRVRNLQPLFCFELSADYS